jgi:glyoxylase-like metal-dependent hydrolase (beta-lactamase superfamily II)
VRVERFPVGPFDNNLYLLTAPGSPEAIVVDPSGDDGAVLDTIRGRGLTIARILLTHAQIDHIRAVKPIQDATGAPVWLHSGDRAWFERGRVRASTTVTTSRKSRRASDPRSNVWASARCSRGSAY